MGCGAAVGVYLLGVPRVPSLEGSGPVGSGGLTSRVCVFTKGTSPSRIVPSYKSATSRCPRCRSCAWSPRRRTCTCHVHAHVHVHVHVMHMCMCMFMCMRTTARGAARHGSSRRPLQIGQEIETGSSATASFSLCLKTKTKPSASGRRGVGGFSRAPRKATVR